MQRLCHRKRLTLATLFLALAALAACAPFGPGSPPPQVSFASATATANVYATGTAASNGGVGANGSPVASLPSLQPDPGWVAVAQVPDGAKLGGPTVSGGAPGASTVSMTMTLGSFTLSSAARVAIVFGCVSVPSVHATVEVGLTDGESVRIQCGETAQMDRSEMTFPATSAGQRLTVTATISTDGAAPHWYALVEQPK